MPNLIYPRKAIIDVPTPEAPYFALFEDVADGLLKRKDSTGAVSILITGTAPNARYDHTQAIAAATWTINHNLGFKPTVAVLNLLMQEVGALVEHVTNNQAVIHLDAPLAGYAILTS